MAGDSWLVATFIGEERLVGVVVVVTTVLAVVVVTTGLAVVVTTGLAVVVTTGLAVDATAETGGGEGGVITI